MKFKYNNNIIQSKHIIGTCYYDIFVNGILYNNIILINETKENILKYINIK